MAANDVRRVLATRRKADRDRKRRQRDAEAEVKAPSQVVIDRAIATAYKRVIIAGGGPQKITVGSDLGKVATEARAVLRERGFSLRSERGRVLFARALGEESRTFPITPSP